MCIESAIATLAGLLALLALLRLLALPRTTAHLDEIVVERRETSNHDRSPVTCVVAVPVECGDARLRSTKPFIYDEF